MIINLHDLIKSTGSVFRSVAYLFFPVLFCNNAWAQYDYGTGADGAYTAPAGTTILSGTYNYTSFSIPAGDTIIAGGKEPLIIKCMGNVVISGILTATGGNGGIGGLYNSGLGYCAGGVAGAGGAGGWGAAGGAGGTGNAYGPYASDYGVNGLSFGNLGGAGYGGHPYDGTSTQQGGTGGSYGALGTASAANGGAAINSSLGNIYGDAGLVTTATVNSITTDLLGGSGGGGGGGHDQSVTGAPALQGGDGGGGGGGAIRITAYNITLNTGGLISVRGGNSMGQSGRFDAGGGGGSGGTINLQYAFALTGPSVNTTPTFTSGTVDIAGGHGGHFGTTDYAVGGEGGQGRYLAQQDPNPPGLCSAPAMIPEANGGASPATVCSGSVTLSSNPTGGSGCTGTYQNAWNNGTMYWNGSGFLSASPVYNAADSTISPVLSSNGSFTTYSRCTGDTTCVNSASVTVNVSTNITPSVSISTPQTTTICQGTAVTFNATPTNGGTVPVYQWMKNSKDVGTGSASYSDSALHNNDTVYCVLTSNAGCLATPTATSNMLVMTVNPTFVPTISIQTPQTTICQGQPATFSSTTNSNTSVYQWKVNGAPVGSSSTYNDNNVANNDTVLCVLTSSEACANPSTVTSSPVIMTVTALPSAGIISAEADTVCTGSNAHLILTGSTGTIDWQSAATPTDFTDAGANGAAYYPGIQQTTYYRVITRSGSCTDTSAVFLLTAAPVPLLSFDDTVRGSTVTFNASASTYTDIYNWTFGDGTSSDSMNPVHIYADTTASYFVCINGTNSSNCSSQICQTINITGLPTDIRDLTPGDLCTVYPTPFTDYVVINVTSSSFKIKEINVYNLLGQQVYNRDFDEPVAGNLRLDIPSLAAGTYFLRIKSAGIEPDFIQTLVKQ